MRALAVLVAAALAAPAAAHAAPGAAGIGDPLFPELGNGGYDALHYAIALRYPTTAPHQRIGGTVTMRARATQALSRFDLDYAGGQVLAVSVDGRPARFRRSGGELIVTPRRAVAAGRDFRARVAFASRTHNVKASDKGFTTGWFTTADGSVMAGQPNDTHTIFPVNDHPADKATYAFRIDVPAGITAVANGQRTGRRTAGGRTVWRYAMRQPMASELVQVVAGLLKVTDQGRPHGVRIRSVADLTVARRVAPAISRTPAHVAWMVKRVGRYPFPEYGVLAADAGFAYALETQTLSLFPADLLDARETPASVYDPIMVHELAHQWFGDSVAPRRWSDVWLNEGHATWYEHEYGQELYGQSALAYYKDAYKRGNQLRARYGPVAAPKGNRFNTLFSDNVYSGGGLALLALQLTVGDPTFRRIERTWAQGERGKSVGTEDFIRVASRVAGQDLGPFLRAWLFGTTLPPMPGHPDWKAAPVKASAAALEPVLARSALPLPRR